MESFTGVLLVIALFVLRLGVPILITVLIGYGLSRLDARWQAEADAEQRAQEVVRPAANAEVTQQKEAPRPAPRPAMPAPTTLQETYVRDHAGRPCWGLRDCAEAVMDAISACERGDTPCWEARRLAEGRLPEKCRTCEVYKETVDLWTEKMHQRGIQGIRQENWH